jgi:hypothetical protein
MTRAWYRREPANKRRRSYYRQAAEPLLAPGPPSTPDNLLAAANKLLCIPAFVSSLATTGELSSFLVQARLHSSLFVSFISSVTFDKFVAKATWLSLRFFNIDAIFTGDCQ